MKRAIVLLFVLASVSLAQPARVPVDTVATVTLAFAGDSIAVSSKNGVLRFSVFNSSATDTVYIRLCATNADTTGTKRGIIVLPASSGTWFNYVGEDARWVNFIRMKIRGTGPTQKVPLVIY